MEVKTANAEDKDAVIKFCTINDPDDYIQDTWDTWLDDGGLYVVWNDGDRIGVFNVTVHSKQGWIEGVRVHPDFRRLGYGSRILNYAEQIIRKLDGSMVRYFVDVRNTASIQMSRNNGYLLEDTYTWYDKAVHAEGKYDVISSHKLPNMQYVDSWRVYDLEDDRDVLFLKNSTTVIKPSKHFRNTILATVLEANDLDDLVSYMTLNDLGASTEKMHGWRSGIHIVSKLDESLFKDNFNKISAYHLMVKNLLTR